MKIGLDAMGGDAAPETTIAGAIRAARELPAEVVLFGDQGIIEQHLKRYARRPSNLSIVHAPQVIAMNDPPVASVRRKKASSINIGIRHLRDRQLDAFVSAGNTGAVVGASTLFLGMLKGAERPGLALLMPSLKQETLMIDVGANIGPKPAHLLQYALMADAYMRFVLEREHPSVGLLNVGEEESKGTEFIRETYSLLEGTNLNFVGNVEGRDIFSGDYDIIVCDGFAGNVALKTAESLAHAIGEVLRRSLGKNPITRLGAWLSRGAFQALRKEIDYAEHGGALLLGVSGVCIIGHGGSSAKAIKNAVRAGYESARHDITTHLIEALQDHRPT